MIGYISGTVLENLGKKILIVNSAGTGYEVNYGFKALRGDSLELHIHHHITENDQSLWGFRNLEEKRIFQLLITVNKVGASKAYPLIAVVGMDRVLQAIQFEDAAILAEAPGIGKKMAEQIILSLKDKLADLPMVGMTRVDEPTDDALGEAVLALQALGYDRGIVLKTAKNLSLTGLNTEDIIKNILQKI